MRIGIAITRASAVDPTWTTVQLARTALERGHSIRFIEPWDFEIDGRGNLVARSHAFDPPAPDAVTLAHALGNRTAARRFVDVARMDVLLLRASPLDTALLTFALMAKDLGVQVVNDPAGLLRASHKAWLASLPDVSTPATIVTRSIGAAQVFYDQQPTGVVVKPARGSGGRGVTQVKPRDHDLLDACFFAAQALGDGYVVVQAYLPAAEDGEKRIVWMDGVALGGYLRERAPGEFRHNLKRGGQAHPTDFSATEIGLISRLSPHLLRCGIRLAGIDVIGDHITEVNALNPGGAFHTDRLSGSHLAETIISKLETGIHPPVVPTEQLPWQPAVP